MNGKPIVVACVPILEKRGSSKVVKRNLLHARRPLRVSKK